MVSVGRRGSEQPGQIGRIKFNAAKIVWFVVDGKVARLSADDMPRINADDIPRPEHLHLHGRGLYCSGSAAFLDVKRELHTQAGPPGQGSVVVRVADAGSDAAPRPAQEVIAAKGRITHAVTSCTGRICRLLLSSGCRAR